MNHAEKRFAASLRRQGKKYVAQPGPFALPAPYFTYRPDFYVPDENCYYEVVGTRQAFSLQVGKINAFRSHWSSARLEIVNVGAWKRGPKVDIERRGAYESKSLNSRLAQKEADPASSPNCKRIIQIIRETRSRSVSEFVNLFGLKKSTVHSILRGETDCPGIMSSIEEAFSRYIENEIDPENIQFRLAV